MGVLQGMSRPRGRSLKGQRVYDLEPFYRGCRVTVVGAMSQSAVLAMQTLGKSMTGEDFKRFVSEHLVPKLWQGAVVVMDNLKAHKVEGIEQMIEAVGARVVYLSPYSPEFNPIEHLWWQLKAFIRRFVPKSVETITKLLQVGVSLCSSKELRNYFAHCCYCTN
nr:MAG: transposase [Leptolyngbya sp. IPPAS B-1204]RNJ65431.1 MAG: transposase [Leptolyngbya sp. IPPAS B-1204]RNJ65988.1 MAG: transposase [Leptolyngbya sp. IPPAS B-1204]RNJ66563.1 MAG: transposase [Leptolyngbya sp. IPPAS B-1204]RNJ66811.1 MAG: transposase [Leptolyngbya sp. IPPAS B-1204]